MYLYFDVNGNLKEIVYYPVREGDVGTNSIYIYVEPEVVTATDGIYVLGTRFTNAKINFRLLDSNISLNNNAIEMSKLTGDDAIQLPYDRKRDLKYFKYGYKYEMWAVTLSSDNMSVTDANGVVTASAYLYNTTEQQALNKFNFNVEDSVTIIPDSTITQSQYSYLYNLYHSGFASEYVPYERATRNVDLNEKNLNSVNLLNFTPGGQISVDSEGNMEIELGIEGQTGDLTIPYDVQGTLATQEWIALNYVPLDSSINVPYAVIYDGDQSTEYLKIGPSDSALYIYRNKLVKEVGGVDNTYNFDATDEGGTFTLATREWVNNQIPSVSGLVPYSNASGNVDLGTFELKAKNLMAYNISVGSTVYGPDKLTSISLSPAGIYTIDLPKASGTIALTKQLPSKGLCATFSTSDFTVQTGGNYAALNIAVSDFIANSDMLIITWDNCFALCPIPQSGPGRVCAAMWNVNGESQVVRIKYELKTNNTLLDVSLSGGFTPPSGHTAYVQCIKLF